MIKLEHIDKTFRDSKNPFSLFNDFNLEIEEGKFTAILGRSGCGKSTLLNLIGSLDKPDFGTIYFRDMDITKFSRRELEEYRNTKIGFIFQSFFLEPGLTVLDNILIPLAIKGVPLKERRSKGMEILKRFDIDSKADEPANHLSGGEQQRVCIARALINNPDLILADEPTGHLDYENGQLVLKLLRSIADEGKTVILVTHNEDDAKKYADTIVRMQNGKICGAVSGENS